MCRKKKNKPLDANQEEYRKFFKIEDKILLYYEMDEKKNVGYIVFINKQNDLDFVDKRDKSSWKEEELKEFQRCLGKIQAAEMTPCMNLSEKQVLVFKQYLGQGYLQILQRDFEGIDEIIENSLLFLQQRNVETSRQLFLQSGGFVALLAAITGLVLYFTECRTLWYYGILFGVLGSYVSIWTRYGKEEMTGLASVWLHILESISRLFIGAIAAVIAMFAIRSGLMLAIEDGHGLFFLYCVFAFAAGFIERFIPSLLEKLVTKEISSK